MSPTLQRLVDLQQIDTAIAAARQEIAAHPERLAALETCLSSAREAVDAAKQHLKDNHDSRRALEKDAAVYQGRLSKFKDQLSAVKTNREYTAMQHEIATAQAELSTAEERVIEQLVEADAVTAAVREQEAAFSEQQQLVNTEKADLARDLAAAEARLVEKLAARTAVLAAIEPGPLALFEQVARARKGVALCTATHAGLCSVCHVRLRPQVFQQVRQNDQIIQCDSCQRILYYIPPPPPIEQPVVHA